MLDSIHEVANEAYRKLKDNYDSVDRYYCGAASDIRDRIDSLCS